MVNNTSKFNKHFLKNYDENSDTGYNIESDVKYPKRIYDVHNDLPFLRERMQIKKCSKLVCILNNKNNYVVYIKTLKHGLKLMDEY